MIQLALFLLFLCLPFMLIGSLGFKWGWKMALSVIATMVIMGIGSIVALFLVLVAEPSILRSYVMLDLWTNRYVNTITGEAFYRAFAIPFITAIDFLRLFFHFGINSGVFKVWIPMGITCYAWFIAMRKIWTLNLKEL